MSDLRRRPNVSATRPLVLATAVALGSGLLWAGAPALAAAQDLDPQALAERLRAGLREAGVSGDENGLGELVILARRAVTAFPDDALLNHYAGYALYRLATRILEGNPARARGMLEEAESFLERSMEIEPIAESHALLASALGMRIDGPVSAMTLGRRSTVALTEAKLLGPRNPRVKLLEGLSVFHAPRMFGGGPNRALRHFLAAVDLFADDAPEPPLPAWGHAEAWAWIGQAHAAMGRMEEARGAYERALELEPGYMWVREVLLPGLG